jgi:hypothetical protein
MCTVAFRPRMLCDVHSGCSSQNASIRYSVDSSRTEQLDASEGIKKGDGHCF